MKTEPVKGFRDYSGEEAKKRAEMQKIIVETFEKYGFEPAETPVIEYEEFVRGDNKNDEAVSDIFSLKDKGKRELALRYEFTFQLKRLMQNKKLPYKRYEIGPVFRDEPVGSARFRQFIQCDVDVVGAEPRQEAEVLSAINDIFQQVKLNPIILVNNRQLLNEILESEKVKTENREQVLREIDKYDKISEKELKENLKKLGAEKIIDLLKKGESYFSKFESYKKIISLMDYCRSYGFEVKFSPTIVRGLSYYDGNVFEIKSKGIKETLAGGGSYTFDGTPCTGISFGLERLSILAEVNTKKESYLVISINQDREAIKLSQKLRKNNAAVSLFYGKPSKALEYANAYSINKVVFVGEKEVKNKKFTVKDMDSGKESALKI
ncbi:MAG TPA: ATP phosphoribosyltransferase regulatory subunit [Candidatus Pacearchaeota archaeon]|nr:ATP phosphoribosyltransferase regulatory subunit [Candidatus Pacearchaeota archaeon]